MSRGATDGQTTSPEEQALADVILRHKPLPLAIAGDTATGAGASLASPVSLAASAGTAGPTAAGTAAATSLDSRSSAPVPPPHTSIRIHVLVGKIDDVARNAVQGEPPIDCIAVGHYLRVLPTGAELDLDRAISKALQIAQAAPAQGAPAAPADSDEDLLISQFHERGILRGDLGVPFWLPDPRPGFEGNLLLVAGMEPVGEFGIPELTLLARSLPGRSVNWEKSIWPRY